MKAKNIVRVVVSLIMLATLVCQFGSWAVSVSFHATLGIVWVLLLATHLALNSSHWRRDVPKLFRRGQLTRRVRLTYILTILMFICAVLLVMSGICLYAGPAYRSVPANTNASGVQLWHAVHSLCAGITVILACIHLLIHGGFITMVFRSSAK